MPAKEADRGARDKAPIGTARIARPIRARGAPVVKERLAVSVPQSIDTRPSDVVWLTDAGGVVEFLRLMLPRDTWVIVIDGAGSDLAESVTGTIRRASAAARFWTIHGCETQAGYQRTLVEDAIELDLTDEADAAVRDNLVADLAIIPEKPFASRDDRIRRWQQQTASMLIEGPVQAILRHATELPDRPPYFLLAIRPSDHAHTQDAGVAR